VFFSLRGAEFMSDSKPDSHMNSLIDFAISSVQNEFLVRDRFPILSLSKIPQFPPFSFSNSCCFDFQLLFVQSVFDRKL